MGSKLMVHSLDLFVRTQGYGIPWRRYLLALIWLIGFCIFCGGLKINLGRAHNRPKNFLNPLSCLKFRQILNEIKN